MAGLFGTPDYLKCCCGSTLCECDGRCVPLEVDTEASEEVPTTRCDNPLPVTLGVDVSATSNQGGTCFNGSGTITYKTAITGGVNCWEGDITGSCTDCNGNSRTWIIAFKMCCPDSVSGTTVTMTPNSPGIINPVDNAATTVIPTSCNPFLAEGCIPGDITAFVTACIASMPPTAQIFTDVCFQVYELP